MGSQDGEFGGTERYVVRRRLGAGGFGVVYHAFDTQHGADVALKVLRSADPGTLYRFKREFRALADVAHPNLVGLRELESSGDHWFFTMELVEGENFLEHVWGQPLLAPVDEETSPTPGLSPGVPPPRPGPRVDEARLRPALLSLALGVDALHQAGCLHRDIKPSNVLVDRKGRVVLLDFGLVAELQRAQGGESTDAIVGTVAYMSPEQGAHRGVAPASDWYSVGALLYECLTGRVPFVGSAVQVLLDRERVEPPPPSVFAPAAPPDLDQLCQDLLRLDPAKRPTGAEVLERLAGAAPRPSLAPSAAGSTQGFVGRVDQLAVLDDALGAVAAGKSVAAFVRGRSGMGKTALARRFLEPLERDPAVTVLQGRCFQREFVPYKTLDSLVDSLARTLVRLPAHQVEALLPRDVHALAQVFPVLKRVELVANAQRRVPQAPDPQELRRRAFAGLRELLARMGDRSRLVLFIDDLQWGDADGTAFLAELFRPPDPPNLLLLASYRAEEEASLLVLRAMIAAHAEGLPAVRSCEVTVDVLSQDEAAQLARVRLAGAGEATLAQAEAIARECGGSPIFLDVLTASAARPAEGAVNLEQVLRGRVERLPAPQRHLLEVVAVAARPVSRAVAFEAARLARDPLGALAGLEAERFLRAFRGPELDTVEMFHDRLREPVLARLSPGELAALHLRLARALEASVQRDDETLARHYAEGGERETAAAHAARAAERASATLAFDHAAFLTQWALELADPTDVRRRQWEIHLGDALALAGRGPEAARAYSRALGAPAETPLAATEALEVRRRAAEQLLRSGHTDEGLEAIAEVLEDVQLKVARTPQTARASLLWRRTRVRLRGLHFRERDASQVPPAELIRIDVCWAASQGLGMVDVIRGSAFQAKHLLLALDSGEPYRVARALAMEAAFASVGGARTDARVEAILGQARALAQRLDHPEALGMVRFAEGMRELLCGRWPSAHRAANEAVQIFRDRAKGVSFERVTAQLVSVWSLFFLGQLRDLTVEAEALQREAAERGDQYAVTASGLTNLALLVGDEPETARRRFEETLGQWSTRGFHLPHYWGLLAQSLVDFYAGEHRAPWERLQRAWPALRGSLLLNIQHVRITSVLLRAHSALQAAVSGLDREGMLARAEADARRIEREQATWGAPLVELLRGSVAMMRQQDPVAIAHLQRAEDGFRAQQMAAFAAATRRRRGELVGGDEGAALIASADGWLRGQHVQNPARFAAMLTPGR